MKIIADTHTHTLVSGHAYSTLHENAAAAARQGMRFLIATEHTNKMPGAPRSIYFRNKRAVPKELEGVEIIFGCEVNVEDYQGGLDLKEEVLADLDWVIASMHAVTLPPATEADHTAGWLAVAQNPQVDVIGHCGNSQFPFDYEEVIPEFGRRGKIVEINNHSFNSQSRPNSGANCERIAGLCARFGVPIVVSSDAHSEVFVGKFESALAMLERIHFPEELVLNADPERFRKVLLEKRAQN